MRNRFLLLLIALLLGATACSTDEASDEFCEVALGPWAVAGEERAYDLVIFFDVGADQGDIDALEALLGEDQRVSSHNFWDSQESYAEFSELFADNREIVASVEPDSLPTSFRLALADPTLIGEAADDYRSLPGVQTVVEGVGEIPTTVGVLLAGFEGIEVFRGVDGTAFDDLIELAPDELADWLEQLRSRTLSGPEKATIASRVEVAVSDLCADGGQVRRP